MAVLGSNLETQEIKHHFWVRTQDFQTSILFPVFNSKVQVWLLSSLPAWCSFSWLLLRNLNSILGLFAYLHSSVFTSQQLQTVEQSSNPDFEADFYLGSNPGKFLGFKPENSHFLVYFNRPIFKTMSFDFLHLY